MVAKHISHQVIALVGHTGGLSTIVREEGVRAAYRGLHPTVLALLPTWALYFTTYEFLKKRLKAQTGASRTAAIRCGACLTDLSSCPTDATRSFRMAYRTAR
jgi:Mitochondrial carrier protein